MSRLRRAAPASLAAVLLVTMPWWLGAVGGYTELATRIVVLGLAAMALNFLLGFTGVLSFGHAAYFGLGGYGAAMALKYLAPSDALAVAVGVAAGTVAAALIGALIVKLRGVYFAMVTIAFGQVFYFITFRWDSVTGGDDGLTGWSRLPLRLGPLALDVQHRDLAFYYFVLALFGIAAAVMGAVLRSPFGRTLLAIRENERRARFLGINIERHIWLAFTISAFFIAIAGGLYALLNNFADPSSLYTDLSGELVIMCVLGGIRVFWGPLLGAAVYVVLQDWISSHTVNWMFFVGLIFVVVVMFFPRGLLGIIRRRSSEA